MNKFNITSCPLCKSERLAPFSVCKDYYATGELFPLLRCDDCGFLMTQGAPIEAEMGRYYETNEYISHSNTRKGVMNYLYHLVRGWMLTRKTRLVCRATKAHRGAVLDIGTGTGYFAGAMLAAGWHVTAIEKSEQARLFAKAHFGLDVLDNHALPTLKAGSFDVITMWHVLEHIEQLNEMGEHLNRLLKSRGIAVIALPNALSADAVHYGKGWAAYDVPRHLWHFTPATLERFAHAHGFKLKKQVRMPYDSFYVAMLSEKNLGSRAYLLKGMWYGLLAWIKSNKRVELSSSIIYILQKR